MADIKKFEPFWGSWYLKETIGEGGFGKVYKIERNEFENTYTAALKHLRIPNSRAEIKSAIADGMSRHEVKDYFGTVVKDIIGEFVLMSKLKGNSNIVSYEDHMVIEDEEEVGWDIFIRMEFLESLIDYIQKNDISKRTIIKLGIDICRALEICQKHNIIHRDIKPENIFISENGDFKLGDFGIARQVEKTEAGLSKKGTYTYIAPEVYKGEPYGSTVDIYSLGIVMYRLLNNNRVPFMPPWPSPITHAARETALIKRITGQQPKKPINADGRLAEIVLKACSYNPKDRYESPRRMREELEDILYSEKEARVIYPKGDKAEIHKIDYISSKNASAQHKNLPYENKKKAVDLAIVSEGEKTKTMVLDVPFEAEENKTQTMAINAPYETEEMNNLSVAVNDKNDSLPKEQNYAAEAYAYKIRMKEKKTEEIRNNNTVKEINKKRIFKLKKVPLIGILFIIVGIIVNINTNNNYKQANKLLNEGDYFAAEEIFEELGDYKDSKTSILKCKYKYAESIMNKLPIQAFNRFKALGDYLDSKQKLEELKCTMYYKAVESYHNGEYEEAKNLLSYCNKSDEVNNYLLLSEARTYNNSSKIDIQKLYEIIDFDDTKMVLMSDFYIKDFLTGKWNNRQGYYIEFYINEEDNNDIWCTYNMPVERSGGKYYKIENKGQYYGDDETGWVKYWSYEIVSINEINVTISQNGEVYRFTRA